MVVISCYLEWENYEVFMLIFNVTVPNFPISKRHPSTSLAP